MPRPKKVITDTTSIDLLQHIKNIKYKSKIESSIIYLHKNNYIFTQEDFNSFFSVFIKYKDMEVNILEIMINLFNPSIEQLKQLFRTYDYNIFYNNKLHEYSQEIDTFWINLLQKKGFIFDDIFYGDLGYLNIDINIPSCKNCLQILNYINARFPYKKLILWKTNLYQDYYKQNKFSNIIKQYTTFISECAHLPNYKTLFDNYILNILKIDNEYSSLSFIINNIKNIDLIQYGRKIVKYIVNLEDGKQINELTLLIEKVLNSIDINCIFDKRILKINSIVISQIKYKFSKLTFKNQQIYLEYVYSHKDCVNLLNYIIETYDYKINENNIDHLIAKHPAKLLVLIQNNVIFGYWDNIFNFACKYGHTNIIELYFKNNYKLNKINFTNLHIALSRFHYINLLANNKELIDFEITPDFIPYIGTDYANKPNPNIYKLYNYIFDYCDINIYVSQLCKHPMNSITILLEKYNLLTNENKILVKKMVLIYKENQFTKKFANIIICCEHVFNDCDINEYIRELQYVSPIPLVLLLDKYSTLTNENKRIVDKILLNYEGNNFNEKFIDIITCFEYIKTQGFIKDVPFLEYVCGVYGIAKINFVEYFDSCININCLNWLIKNNYPNWNKLSLKNKIYPDTTSLNLVTNKNLHLFVESGLELSKENIHTIIKKKIIIPDIFNFISQKELYHICFLEEFYPEEYLIKLDPIVKLRRRLSINKTNIGYILHVSNNILDNYCMYYIKIKSDKNKDIEYYNKEKFF